MTEAEQLRSAFRAAVTGDVVLSAQRLCRSFVELLEVDGAAISLMASRDAWGTLGASGASSRRVDELQFTFGEGPCLEAVRRGRPVLMPDLGSPSETRWPAFVAAVLEMNIRGVFAFPVADGSAGVGALDLFRHRPGAPTQQLLAGGLIAAEAAAIPLTRLIAAIAAETGEDQDLIGRQRSEASWERVEVYQAMGMIMAQLDVTNDVALVRLRAYAFAHGATAMEVAHGVVARRIILVDDRVDGQPRDEGQEGS